MCLDWVTTIFTYRQLTAGKSFLYLIITPTVVSVCFISLRRELDFEGYRKREVFGMVHLNRQS